MRKKVLITLLVVISILGILTGHFILIHQMLEDNKKLDNVPKTDSTWVFVCDPTISVDSVIVE